MPIFDLGYRPWKGAFRSLWLRWWVITRAGLVQSWKIGWVQRALLTAWGPALAFAGMFFIYEQVPFMRPMVENFTAWVSGDEVESNEEDALSPAMGMAIGGFGLSPQDLLPEDEKAEVEQQNHRRTWDWLFASMLSYSQFGFLVVVIGLVAPPLISSDIRTKAFLIYFSRPISKTEYIFGKAFVLWFFLILVVLLPVLVVYCAAILVTPDFEMARLTYDIPLRIVAATAVMLVPATLAALAFSSLSTEQRTPALLWYGMLAIGFVAWITVWSQQRFSGAGEVNPHWVMLSFFHTIARVEQWVFGLENSFLAVAPEVALLVVISAVSIFVLYYRVSSPMSN